MKRDYYEILGINKNASAAEIKKAYRKLAKKYHPDTDPGNKEIEKKFQEISEAYDVLGDPEKKKKYDTYGADFFESGMGEGQGGFNGFGGFGTDENGTRYRTYHFEGDPGQSFEDIFSDLFHGTHFEGTDGGGSAFHRSFHGFSGNGFAGQGSDFSDRGFGGFSSHGREELDLNSEIRVSFEEAALGCEKTIRLQDQNGRLQTLQIHIPAGIEDGKSVRLRGKGKQGRNGGRGDLLIQVHIMEKKGYSRQGRDVYSTAQIPFTTAVFGGEAFVETLYGRVQCKIAPGTQSGSRIRLRGKGTVSPQQPNQRGDQYVTIQIQVPKNLTGEQLQKLKEFEKSMKSGSGERRAG